MTYRAKYRALLTVAVIGGLLVVLGSFEIQGSFGIAEIIQAGLTKLIIGLLLFIVAVPIFYVLCAKGDPRQNRLSMEIDAIKRKANLK